jgi:hypothetical protein
VFIRIIAAMVLIGGHDVYPLASMGCSWQGQFRASRSKRSWSTSFSLSFGCSHTIMSTKILRETMVPSTDTFRLFDTSLAARLETAPKLQVLWLQTVQLIANRHTETLLPPGGVG